MILFMSKEKTKRPSIQTNPISFKELQIKIEDFKNKRDDLNKKTKDYITRLQEIDSEIIESLKLARDVYKKKRDQWNKKVKKLKDKKIEYKDLLDTLIEEKRKHSKSKFSGKGAKIFGSIKQIEKKIDNLERTIETENLDINYENTIVDKIRELAIKKEELLSEQQNDELYILERKEEIVRINLNKIYEQLTKWSDKSQEYHGKMHELYGNVNELRDSKKKMEEELIENKKSADHFHEQYLELMNQRKKINKNKGRNQSYKPRNNQSRQKGRKTPYQRRSNENNAVLEKLKQDKLAEALEKQRSGKKLNLFEARLVLEHHK